jgi:hypothetical protein
MEVPPPLMATSFPLTLVTDYEQGTENQNPITKLIELERTNYPAVSPTSAETILALDPTLNATIHATAYGLATTVCEQMAQYTEKVAELEQKVQRLEQVNEQCTQDN